MSGCAECERLKSINADLLAVCQDGDLDWILRNAVFGDISADNPATLDRLIRFSRKVNAAIQKATGV